MRHPPHYFGFALVFRFSSFCLNSRSLFCLPLFLLLTPWLAIGAPTSGEGKYPPQPLEKVVLQLKWWHQFQFAGYYAAIEQGYYREAGLDVELRDGGTAMRSTVDLVLEKKADFGVGNSGLILRRGQGAPVVLLANIFQHSPLVLIARNDMTTTAPIDLARHPLMIEPFDPEIFVFFKRAGIDPGQLNVVHQSRKMTELAEGKVAAMSAYVTDWNTSVQRDAKMDISLISPRSCGVDFPGDNLFTTEELVQRYPGRVRRFREASLRGWEYALAHPEEIIELILEKYPTQKTRSELLFEAHQVRQHIQPEFVPIGTMNEQQWNKVATAFEEAEMLPGGKEQALRGFFYEGYLRADPRVLYWICGSIGVVLLAALVWGVPLLRMNRRLKLEVADRRRAEEEARLAWKAAEAASESKDRFLATITHEIRTPLNIVVSYAQTLTQREHFSKEEGNAVRAIVESGQHLLKLVEDVLDLSKIEAGGGELRPHDFDLTLLLQGLNAAFEAPCRSKGIEFLLLWKSKGTVMVHGDEGRLRQVLYNLLGNAVKFTSQGNVVLSVNLEASEAPDAPDAGEGRYLFEVVDHGPGISEHERSSIFEPFAQSELGARLGGTGLGLPITQHILQLMGSEVRVQSIEGKGSRFFFSLALPPARGSEVEGTLAPPVKQGGTLAEGCRVRALVVDDVELNRVLVGHLLETLGCEVRSVSSGEEAVALAGQEAFNIAFIDLRMHLMDGVETAHHLRTCATEWEHPLRIVCFSAAAEVEVMGATAVFDDFLPKPFRFERVRQCIEALPGVRFEE